MDIQSPNIHLLHKEEYLLYLMPISRTEKMSVKIKDKEASMDIFVNYIVKMTIYDTQWMEQSKNISLMVIHTILHKIQTLDTIARDKTLSLKKLAEEG